MAVRNLIIKLVVFSVILSGTYFFAMWQVAQGQVDYFYTKFTHRAGSLILGISRANDGISPAIIEQNFANDEIAFPVLNFAFAHQTSDFGPAYLNAIQKKLLPGTKNGLFILEVNPASLSILKSKPDSESTLEEDQSFLADMHRFNQHPNFEYIRKMYNQSLYRGFQKSRRIDKIRYSHPDGWQEVMVKNEFYEVSEEEVLKWKEQKLNEATTMMEFFKPSRTRLQYFEKTISYLQDFGKVYLVRIPVSAGFLKTEHSYWPELDAEIEEIAARNNVVYFNYSDEGKLYKMYDGTHLFGSGAKSFTQQLCDDIKAVIAHGNN